ncbi:MAG TPA: hypothetical protein CFH79_06055 [Sulfurospirillum sp. UBA11407]|nr:MAG TPA: hypothetical protein CFH79_06055 [Sulfurospirillum sp. UBA11407]
MNLVYKKCDVCGTNINKLQSWWNIYMLKTGVKLKCPKCETEYKTNKFIGFIGSWYSFILWIIPIFFIVHFLDSFNLHFGIEVWIYAVVLYSIIEFIVMVILPLKKIENKEGEKDGN